jgi:carboxymethylenebutenolidase
MKIETSGVRFGERDEFDGFLVAPPGPASGPLPGVVVIQEAWGVDAHIEDVARRFAEAGYVALAPDVYARGGARPAPLARERLSELVAFFNQLAPGAWADPAAREAALATFPPEARPRIEESFAAVFGGIGSEEHLDPVVAAARFLRERHAPTRGMPVGSVGFCMGGGLSARLACADPRLAAAVVFYGSAPPEERIPAIRCPVLGLYGGRDARITGGVPSFADAMRRHGKRFEPVVYADAQHAFFNDARPAVFDVHAMRDAWARVLAFFREHLRSEAPRISPAGAPAE